MYIGITTTTGGNILWEIIQKPISLFPKLDLNFLPVNGVTNAAAVLSLMLGWGKEFVFLCDSDAEGKAAMRRYQEELPTMPPTV